jgi:membrane protein implicated in regulation of membrane protease activity
VTFSVLSVGSIVLARKLLSRHPIDSDRPLLNRRAAQYVGRVFVLAEPIVNGAGKIRIDDSTWRVRGTDAPTGGRVRVVDADGVILCVETLAAPLKGGDGTADS